MKQQELCQAITDNSNRIMPTIALGCDWTDWMRVELIFILNKLTGTTALIDSPYPPPFESIMLDAFAKDTSGNLYAIELIVEKNSEEADSLASYVDYELGMLQYYKLAIPTLTVARWVVLIGFSVLGKNEMNQYAKQNSSNCFYQDGGENNVAVLIANIAA